MAEEEEEEDAEDVAEEEAEEEEEAAEESGLLFGGPLTTKPMSTALSRAMQQMWMPGREEREHWEPWGQPASSSPQVSTCRWHNSKF